MYSQTDLAESVLRFNVKNGTVFVQRAVSSRMHHARVEINTFLPEAMDGLLAQARDKQELRKIANDALGNELPSFAELFARPRKIVDVHYRALRELVSDFVE